MTERGQIRLWKENKAATGNLQNYKGLVKYFNHNAPQSEERIEYENLISYFHEKRIFGLNNNLTEEENKRLFVTPHAVVMIALTLKGLANIKQ